MLKIIHYHRSVYSKKSWFIEAIRLWLASISTTLRDEIQIKGSEKFIFWKQGIWRYSQLIFDLIIEEGYLQRVSKNFSREVQSNKLKTYQKSSPIASLQNFKDKRKKKRSSPQLMQKFRRELIISQPDQIWKYHHIAIKAWQVNTSHVQKSKDTQKQQHLQALESS